MTNTIQNNQSVQSRISCICVLMLILIGMCFTAKANQEPAFTLSGTFEDVFADKHNIGGTFTVSAFESNALVDMTFENGYRQVVGTDGHDSFDYRANGQAVISYDRFPSDAHEFQQFLWLICAHDPDIITNLKSYRFPFFAKYNTNDIIIEIITNSAPPHLITSIKWFAPNYQVSGTNHYELAMYPNGYLMAEIALTKTRTNGDAIIPSEVTYKQFNTAPFDLSNLQGSVGHYNVTRLPLRSRSDVVPVELALFSMTNIQVASPLLSYIPEILDKTALVNDKRFPEMGVVKVVSSGKWWMARELYRSREASVKPHRIVVQIILLISVCFPVFLLTRMWRHEKKTEIVTNDKKP